MIINFITQCCQFNFESSISRQKLHSAYNAYAIASNQPRMNAIAFGRAMQQYITTDKRIGEARLLINGKRIRVYLGIELV